MIAQERLAKQRFVEWINYASSTLSLSLRQIQDQYVNHLLSIIDNRAKEDSYQQCIEIRFSDEDVTLTCFFDSRGVCISTFLFPDNVSQINDCVSYLSEEYDYNFVDRCFILDDCFLKVYSSMGLETNMFLEFYL